MKLLKRTKPAKNHSLLKYLISDFLEIHFSEDPALIGRVQAVLLDQTAAFEELLLIPAFSLGSAVVMIEQNGHAGPEKLFVLNAESKQFRTFELTPKP